MSEYYEILGISKDATPKEIAIAYRDLALQHHPQLSKDSFGVSYKKFCQISKAYQILSDKRSRELYNRYQGDFELNQGIFKNGKLKYHYVFDGSPERIFETFFGAESPYQQIFDPSLRMPLGSLLGFTFDAKLYETICDPSDCIVFVECTLKELYNGCKKTVQYEREVLKKVGSSETKKIKEEKELEIEKGFNSSHVIEFPEQGNEASGIKTSNLIFKIKEIPDSTYKRKDNNLIYTAKISLKDALLSTPIIIETLDGRQLNISIDEIISPQTVKIVENEGMPIYEEKVFDVERYGKEPEKGNMIIKFEIDIPNQIDIDKKEKIIEILADCFEREQN